MEPHGNDSMIKPLLLFVKNFSKFQIPKCLENDIVRKMVTPLLKYTHFHAQVLLPLLVFILDVLHQDAGSHQG